MHIILPHIKAQFKLSTPEICEFSLNYIKLASLLLSEALTEHPLFELSIEYESFSVSFGVELGDKPVLFEEHHWVTS